MHSACPLLLSGCKFLNFSRSRPERENRPATDELIGEYLTAWTSIRCELKLSTLKYRELDKLIAAIGIGCDKVCTYCRTGKDVE